MNISSLIVYTTPALTDAVCRQISAMAGAEIHARAEDGRLIAVMEAEDARGGMQMYEAIEKTDGVVSVALVYQHTE